MRRWCEHDQARREGGGWEELLGAGRVPQDFGTSHITRGWQRSAIGHFVIVLRGEGSSSESARRCQGCIAAGDCPRPAVATEQRLCAMILALHPPPLSLPAPSDPIAMASPWCSTTTQHQPTVTPLGHHPFT